MSRCEDSRFLDDFAETRRKPSRSRQDKAAPVAAFRSAWGPGDRGDRARRPAPSIAQARQGYARKRLRVLAQLTVLILPGGVMTSMRRGHIFPRCAGRRG